MHWLWRTVASVAAGLATFLIFYVLYLVISLRTPSQHFLILMSLGVMGVISSKAVGVWFYAFLSRRYGAPKRDLETRCRKCGYILRGLTEPRCPECGEPI